MLNINRYASMTKKAITVKMLALLMLSGCSVASMENDQYHLESVEQTEVVQSDTQDKNRQDTKQNSYAARSANSADNIGRSKVDKIQTTSTKTPVKNSSRNFEITSDDLSSTSSSDDSAACRYIKNTAEAEAIITASPTLSASSDEDGSGSVSIGMNILDIKKSSLLRASGEAKCRLHEAAKKIEATLGLGTELTAYASSKAKESYIRNKSSKLNSLKSRANNLVTQGAISRQDANFINAQIAELYAKMETSRAQAERREGLPNLKHDQIRDGHGALVQATTDLHNINREMRTNEALEVSLSGGYRYNDQFNDDLQERDNPGAYARVNVSVRLGALSSQRNRYEDAAAAAKHDSLYEEYTGVIWKSGYSKKTVDRALVHLKRSEQQLNSAYLQNDDTIINLKGSDRPELLKALIQAQIKSIDLGSELSSVRASIKELKTYKQKLEAL